MAASLLLPLTESTDVAMVGGKAAALANMLHAGISVPPGFVITTAVTALTPDLEASILDRFDALHASFVAVRSSAVGEDSGDAAWAGQLDTFLNTTRDELIDNIKKCWESAQSERAASYAQQRSLQATKPAVIVQAMVQSEVSGVAFSAHPVTQNREQIVIEAGFGLGEAIVSGQITPDTYITDKTSGDIIEKHVSNQLKQLKQSGWKELGEAGAKQKLSDEEITALALQVRQLEQHFGYPVDVEWARADGAWYILQARPITTLA